jgi:hypothetical protein
MPSYGPKSGAPPTFNTLDAFVALVTGDANWSWLIDWLPLVSSVNFETGAFCSIGPPAAVDIDWSDWSTGDRNPFAAAANKIILAAKLERVIYGRIWSAYCGEQDDLGAWSGDVCERLGIAEVPSGPPATWRVVTPPNATLVRHKCTESDGLHGSRTLYAQVVMEWADGTETVQGTYINPTVPTNYQESTAVNLRAIRFDNYDWERSGTICVGFNVGGTVDVPPTVPTRPPDGVEPPGGTAPTTIAELGECCVRMGVQLDTIESLVRYLSLVVAAPGAVVGAPVDASRGEIIDLSGAAGVIVTVSAVRAGADVDFGDPYRLERVGYVTLDTPNGSMAPQELTVNPYVIAPLPPLVRGIRVTVWPPATATVARVDPPK